MILYQVSLDGLGFIMQNVPFQSYSHSDPTMLPQDQWDKMDKKIPAIKTDLFENINIMRVEKLSFFQKNIEHTTYVELPTLLCYKSCGMQFKSFCSSSSNNQLKAIFECIFRCNFVNLFECFNGIKARKQSRNQNCIQFSTSSYVLLPEKRNVNRKLLKNHEYSFLLLLLQSSTHDCFIIHTIFNRMLCIVKLQLMSLAIEKQ